MRSAWNQGPQDPSHRSHRRALAVTKNTTPDSRQRRVEKPDDESSSSQFPQAHGGSGRGGLPGATKRSALGGASDAGAARAVIDRRCSSAGLAKRPSPSHSVGVEVTPSALCIGRPSPRRPPADEPGNVTFLFFRGVIMIAVPIFRALGPSYYAPAAVRARSIGRSLPGGGGRLPTPHATHAERAAVVVRVVSIASARLARFDVARSKPAENTSGGAKDERHGAKIFMSGADLPCLCRRYCRRATSAACPHPDAETLEASSLMGDGSTSPFLRRGGCQGRLTARLLLAPSRQRGNASPCLLGTAGSGVDNPSGR